MKVVVSTPLGQISQETGLVYLLTNYMNAAAAQCINLRCNGIFSLCDRDAEIGWRRSLDCCIRCAKEQSTLSQWAGYQFEDLSKYLPAHDVERTKRWILTVPASELTEATIDEVVPFALCKHLFAARFGQVAPVDTNKQHEQFLRRAMLSVARMTVAARRFLFAQKPNMVFITGARDFITNCLAQESMRMGIDTILFRWNLEARAISIHHPRNGKVLQCELVTGGVTQMRNDTRTWPLEVIATLDDILGFLGIPRGELLVPVAK